VSEDPGLAPEELRKDHVRLTRKLGRIEGQMRHLEQLRDTNARVLERLMVELEEERARSHGLLLNVLPQTVIDRLNAGEQLIADRYDDVAVVFSDFVGSTKITAEMPVTTLVSNLNEMFSAFDDRCRELGVEKIKTIGDGYMAAAGLPGTAPDHVVAAADLAIAMREAVRAMGEPWQVRIGIHCGPVVAGVMGSRKFAYDLWGDTVNVASRFESTSLPDQIQVSEPVALALGDAFELEPRGEVELKGKGATPAYFLRGRRREVER